MTAARKFLLTRPPLQQPEKSDSTRLYNVNMKLDTAVGYLAGHTPMMQRNPRGSMPTDSFLR